MLTLILEQVVLVQKLLLLVKRASLLGLEPPNLFLEGLPHELHVDFVFVPLFLDLAQELVKLGALSDLGRSEYFVI